MKPIHKLNNGRGATLCHKCSVIITTGLTEDLYCEKCKPKQETLEEIAVRLVKETTLYGSQEATIGSSARSYFETELRCVLMGMKWQQQNSYSEEDMQTAFKIGFSIGYGSPVNGLDSKDETCDEWFEQFKKK